MPTNPIVNSRIMKSNTMKTCCLSLLATICATGQLSAQTLADYQAEVTGQSPSNYFKLDSSLVSAVNGTVSLSSFGAGGFAGDVFRNPTNSYFYVNNTDFLRNLTDPLISGGGSANSNATATGSITFLFRTLTGPNVGGQRFLFDATTTSGMGTSSNNAFSLYFENDTSTNSPNALKLRFGDETRVILQASNVLFSTWYYFAITYDESRVPNKAIWYLGPAGTTLSTGMTDNSADAVAGEGTGLIVGQRAGYTGAFRRPGSGRIDEFAIWARELSSTEIGDQFAKLPQLPPEGATYQEVVDSQIPKYYFKLDNSLVESVGGTLMLSTNGTGGAFTTNILGDANSAYSFSATNDALTITNDLFNGGGVGQDPNANGAGTITLQFRMLSDTNNTGQRFLFSAPPTESGSDNNALALFLESPTGANPHSLKVRMGGKTYGNTGSSTPANNVPIAYATNLVPNAWYYIAMVYDETGNNILDVYFGPAGGTLSKSEYDPTNDDLGGGDGGGLAIGNRRDTFTGAFRNPGSGVIDEFAIWHDMLSPAEIETQFAAVTNTPPGPPTLNIAQAGTDVVLSWTTNDTAGYSLESTASLTPASWSSNGPPPTVVDDSYVVTNSAAGGEKYYRLIK